jgi:Ca2+-transporting ATPase
VEAEALVPGDLVVLEAGMLVPADGRLLSAAGLRLDESALTGESTTVEKQPAASLPPERPLAERSNMVYASTSVTAGRGLAVVTATGMETEVGHIAALLLGQGEQTTPLQRKLGEVSKGLSLLCLAVCALLFGVGCWQGRPLTDMLLTSVSLAVAAIPEGLPAIVTIVLALGVGKMAEQKAIVRHLPAVETLGCATVICSDKTGTLTCNRMEVQQIWSLCPQGESHALRVCALCADAELSPTGAVSGEGTERALVSSAHARGADRNRLGHQLPLVGELPFDAQRKCMTTAHRQGSGVLLLVKGGGDVVLQRCSHVLLANGRQPLDSATRRRIRQVHDEMTAQALRVLALAEREEAALPTPFLPRTAEQGLTFLGLVGLADPPRPEARGAVAACHRAGIRPMMITGDHPATAAAIARQLDILRPGGHVLTGGELDALSDEALEAQVGSLSVCARVTPEHKLRIVRALQRRGETVAMTGDGVNDAPALKAADIGCAMGQGGTDVAREAADMVLSDNNFSTLVVAIRQGRGIYANIHKAIHYLLSCNFGEIFTLFLATALGFASMPLLPVQLLWLNLVTDSFPALALGVEPVEAGVMDQPPRRSTGSLLEGGFLWRLGWQGCLIGAVTLLAYALGRPYGLGETMAFATLTFSQLFHAYDVRSERPLRQVGLLTNRTLNRAFALSALLQGAVLLLPPLQGIFSVGDLGLWGWGAVLVLSLVPAAVCELGKGR